MQESSAVFRALADPTRRQILLEMKDRELSAGDIASRFDITHPLISRHLSILKAARLVAECRQANRVLYRLEEDRHLDLPYQQQKGH